MSKKVYGMDLIRRNLQLYSARCKFNAGLASTLTAGELQANAQDRRRWTDRTGNARRSITGSWESSGTRFTVALAIGVYYGIFLETRNVGAYAIVVPTMNEGRRLLQDNYARLSRV